MTMKPQGDPGRIAAMAGQWRAGASRLQSLTPGLDRAVPAGWSGSAHSAFVGAWSDLKGQTGTAAAAMTQASGALDTLSQALSSAQAQWAGQQQLAASNGLVLHDDGTVTGSGSPSPDGQQVAASVMRQADEISLQWKSAQDSASISFATLGQNAVTVIHSLLHLPLGAATGVEVALNSIMAEYNDAVGRAKTLLSVAKNAVRDDISQLRSAQALGDGTWWENSWQKLMKDNEAMSSAASWLNFASADKAALEESGVLKFFEKIKGATTLDAAAAIINVPVGVFVEHQSWAEAIVVSLAGGVAGVAGAAAGAEGGPVVMGITGAAASTVAQNEVAFIWEHPQQAWANFVSSLKAVSPVGVAQNLLHSWENWGESLRFGL